MWSDKQRSFLIESILMEIPIPEVYVQVNQADNGTERYGVVDGQQRLRTILQFVGIERDQDRDHKAKDSNLFVLDALPLASIHKGKAFAEVTGDERKRFFQYDVCVRFLYTEDLREVEDVFKRLNKYTLPLKAQELRNATYHGPFAKLSEQLADDEYWAVHRIVSPAAIRRMADIEMMSDLLIGLLHGPQGGSAKIIDQYYEQYEPYEDEFPEQNRIKRLFAMTVDTIKRLFPEIEDVSRWGNRADFYSLFIAFGNLLRDHDFPGDPTRPLPASSWSSLTRSVSASRSPRQPQVKLQRSTPGLLRKVRNIRPDGWTGTKRWSRSSNRFSRGKRNEEVVPKFALHDPQRRLFSMAAITADQFFSSGCHRSAFWPY
ncbi:MAG: DUF262 domain-containing protein [Blastocatellia bacterium]